MRRGRRVIVSCKVRDIVDEGRFHFTVMVYAYWRRATRIFVFVGPLMGGPGILVCRSGLRLQENAASRGTSGYNISDGPMQRKTRSLGFSPSQLKAFRRALTGHNNQLLVLCQSYLDDHTLIKPTLGSLPQGIYHKGPTCLKIRRVTGMLNCRARSSQPS